MAVALGFWATQWPGGAQAVLGAPAGFPIVLGGLGAGLTRPDGYILLSYE